MDPLIGSTLIQGGASLLGGLFGNSSRRRQARQQYEFDLDMMNRQFDYDKEKEAREQARIELTERERFGWLRDGAQNAGFNPLTVLGATGGRMGNTPTIAGMTAAGRTAPLQISPIGEAIQSAAQAYNPMDFETKRLENELLKEQIDEIKRNKIKVGVQGVRRTASPLQTLGDNQTQAEIDREIARAAEVRGKEEVARTGEESLTDSDGRTTEMVAGEDVSEVITNWFKRQYHRWNWAKEDSHNKAIERFPKNDQRPKLRAWGTLGPAGIQ